MMRDAPFSLLPRPQRFSLSGKTVLVLGLGDTGLSVARWVERHGGTPRVADTRAEPPGRRAFSGELRTGAFSEPLLDGVDCVCISPGLPLSEEIVVQALERGIPVLGDVELFAWENKAKVLAITGTNGKTTVASLTGHVLRTAGIDVEVAGNISPPVLDSFLKRKSPPAAWVLELSSYQLETAWSLDPHAAAMLNLSEDHLDRYASMDEYAAAKARIFQGSGIQVLNRDDPRSMAMALPGRRVVTFGSGGDFAPQSIPAGTLTLHGAHNMSNALAAAALAASLNIPREKIVEGLRTFRGLPHRVELVARRRGVEWYDDSKGTNVGATVAALRGLGKKTVLILGGEGKGQ
ncbi:MAG: UDP-N-acetylmuramoyl-L-alanine--D-glutamate ligase, partial [Betaproteobacteria bacterium]